MTEAMDGELILDSARQLQIESLNTHTMNHKV